MVWTSRSSSLRAILSRQKRKAHDARRALCNSRCDFPRHRRSLRPIKSEVVGSVYVTSRNSFIQVKTHHHTSGAQPMDRDHPRKTKYTFLLARLHGARSTKKKARMPPPQKLLPLLQREKQHTKSANRDFDGNKMSPQGQTTSIKNHCMYDMISPGDTSLPQ